MLGEGTAEQFEDGMFRAYEYLKNQANYSATRFLQLVQERQGVGAAKHLLRPQEQHSDGFLRLVEIQKLHWSVEAWALRPEFRHLFDESELEEARRRLRAAEFDVDRWEDSPWESE